MGDNDSFEKILSLILYSVQKMTEAYNKNPSIHNFALIKNYIIFFMIITLNLKGYPTFIELIFEGQCKFFNTLVDLIQKIKKKSDRKQLFAIIGNLFLEEYKGLYFRTNPNESDEKLENLFISKQADFSNLFMDHQSIYDDNTYKKMFDILLKFELSYENFFKYKHGGVKEEDRPEYKLSISQSIIRVAFSKEKVKFTQEKYFEYYFIKRVIDKDMEETVKKFGDEYKTLFRKEDLCDDVLKYIFFIFGNEMMIESLVKPLTKMLKEIGIFQEGMNPFQTENKKRDITIEEYNILFEKIISGLTNNFPHVLRILLKLLYNSVQKFFTIDKDNYSPLYTSLIFNFIISPRVQMLYSINSLKCIFIRSLNRLLRNTCFNFKFDQNDELSVFNESIEKNHKILKKFMEDKIISIKETDDDVKNSLRDLFTEKYLEYPKFLFYVDSTILCMTIQGGAEKIINFQEIAPKNTKGESNV